MATTAVRFLRSNAFLGWCVLLLCTELIGSALAGGAARGSDFRAFYAAGHIIRTAPSHLYDLATQEAVQNAVVSPGDRVIPFYHPAYEVLFYLPLSFFSFRVAYLIYIAVNAVLVGIAVAFGPNHSSFPLARRSRAPAFFMFLPVLFTIVEGQDSIIFLVLCCFVLRELRKGDALLAGALLGLGVFRPQLAVPLAALLACRYGWRLLAGFLALGAPMTLISALMVQREGVAALYAMLGKASLVQNHGAAAQKAMAVYPQRMPNLYGLLYAAGARALTPTRSFILTAAVSIVLLACSAYVIRRSRTVSSAFGIAVLGTALVSYHLYAYDATILLLPILLLSGRLHFYLVVVCYVLPYVLFFSSIPDWFALYATVPLSLLIAAGVRVVRAGRQHAPANLASAPVLIGH